MKYAGISLKFLVAAFPAPIPLTCFKLRSEVIIAGFMCSILKDKQQRETTYPQFTVFFQKNAFREVNTKRGLRWRTDIGLI